MAVGSAPKQVPRQPVRDAPTRLTVEQNKATGRATSPDHGERQDFGGARKAIPGGPRGDAPAPVTQTRSGDAPSGQQRPTNRGSAPDPSRAESNLKSRDVPVDKGKRQDFGDKGIEARSREGFVKSNPGDANAGHGLPSEPVPVSQRTGDTFRGTVPTGERDYVRRSAPAEAPPKPKRGRNNRWYDHPTSGYVDQPTPPRDAGLARWGRGNAAGQRPQRG